jgi:RimJ/RimL family protein N-acetyltransferase
MDPLLLDIPCEFRTSRLILRSPRAGDGGCVNDAIRESLDELARWMPWASPIPTVEQTESWCRKSKADFIARTQLPMLMFLHDGETFVGSTGIPRLNWDVPWFEIGYWVRRKFEGQGYVTEAVNAITSICFVNLKAERVEIRCDERNARSWRVADRCGFVLEGTLQRDARDSLGVVRDTRVYARVRSTP